MINSILSSSSFVNGQTRLSHLKAYFYQKFNRVSVFSSRLVHVLVLQWQQGVHIRSHFVRPYMLANLGRMPLRHRIHSNVANHSRTGNTVGSHPTCRILIVQVPNLRFGLRVDNGNLRKLPNHRNSNGSNKIMNLWN